MKESNLASIIGVTLFVIAFLTNPNDLEKHKEAFSEYYQEHYLGISKNNSDLQNGVNSLTHLLELKGELPAYESLLSIKNCYFFSLTKIGNETVGVGVFGHVFIWGFNPNKADAGQPVNTENNATPSSNTGPNAPPSDQVKDNSHSVQNNNSPTQTSSTKVKDSKLNIGDSYGGGIIFYIYETGQHGLIAATTDQGIGDWETAKKLSTDYRGGNYADWFLPSIEYLKLLYAQRIVIGGFTNAKYWSSTEFNSTSAWFEDFTLGVSNGNFAGFTYSVRAVRRF